MSEPNIFYTQTAVISWTDNTGLNIRVYASDGNTITERCVSNAAPNWFNGTFKQPGTQVSATVWIAENGPQIRVYATYEGTITEWCLAPPNTIWTKGNYTPA